MNEKDLKYFVHESLGCVIVDSGVTATVSGRVWMECYLDSLSEKEKCEIVHLKSDDTFKFVSDCLVTPMYKLKVPFGI